MPTHVINLTVPLETPENAPVSKRFQVGDPFIRRIHFSADIPVPTMVGFRITAMGLSFVPVELMGCEGFVPCIASSNPLEIHQRVPGPGFDLELEAYNADGNNNTNLTIIIEAGHEPTEPVRVIETTDR